MASGPVTLAPTVVGTASPRPWVWAIGGFLLASLIAGGIALVFMRSGSLSERPAQFTLSFAGQMAGIASTTVPVPSPDGRYFVFVGTSEERGTSLWIRPLDSREAKPLQGTEGGDTPVWSPDGRWIGFFADGSKKVSVSGGPPQTIVSLPGFQDAAWGPSGEIIFRPSNRQPLFRVSESAGKPAPLTQLNAALAENSHRGPSFLPDGRRFLFTSRCAAPENNALYIGSLDSTQVRRIMSAVSKVVFVPSRNGRPAALIYYRDGTLEARAFDPENETLTGDPHPVIAGVDYIPSSIQAFFQVDRRSSDRRSPGRRQRYAAHLVRSKRRTDGNAGWPRQRLAASAFSAGRSRGLHPAGRPDWQS